MGVRIKDIFSNRSSLKDLALRANLVPLRLFLCPEDPVDGVLCGCWVGVAGEIFGEPYRLDCDDREEFGVDGVLMTLSVRNEQTIICQMLVIDIYI